jgi:hypothetical protein
MTSTQQNQPAGIPMFYRNLVPLDVERHAELRIERGNDFSHAVHSNSLPLALHEFGAAAADYPIVFGSAGKGVALAIVGFREAENLFVDADGTWRGGAYIPAYARNYPFAFFGQEGENRLMLGVDLDAPCLGKEAGAPLFEGRKPARALNEALEFCGALHKSLQDTWTFVTALEEAGLLVENQAVINFTAGGRASLGGFRVIDQAKFEALDDQRFLDWRKRGWLPAIYAHFQSLSRWSRIIELGAENLMTAGQQ